MPDEKDHPIKPPSYWDALIPILTLTILLATALYFY